MESSDINNKSPASFNHTIQTAPARPSLPEFAPKIKIGGLFFYVVKLVGKDYEIPISTPKDLEKIQQIAQILFSAHHITEDEKSLKDHNIDYIDRYGIHYQTENKTVSHEEMKAGQWFKHYLEATDDYSWQQHVLEYEEKELQCLQPNHSLLFQNLPVFLKEIIRKRPSFRQESYQVNKIKEIIILYTREKIQETQDIFAKTRLPKETRDQTRKAIKTWTEQVENAKDLINQSNEKLSTSLKAIHIWEKMVETLDTSEPAEYRLVPYEEEEEEFFDALTTLEGHNEKDDSVLLIDSPASSRPSTSYEDEDQGQKRFYIKQEEPHSTFSPSTSCDIQNTICDHSNSSPFRIQIHLYENIENFLDTTPEYQWKDDEESKKLCKTAFHKLEAKELKTLTCEEKSIVKEIIRLRTQVEGFNLLLHPYKYQAIMDDLKRYRSRGLKKNQ